MNDREPSWTLAATWYHENAGVLWLLSARWHEQGSPDDSYPCFKRLL